MATVKKKRTPKNPGCIVIRGVGNEGWNRSMAFTINKKGVVHCRIGCQDSKNGYKTSVEDILAKVAKKYGAKSAYYTMCLMAIKELKRQYKSQRMYCGWPEREAEEAYFVACGMRFDG